MSRSIIKGPFVAPGVLRALLRFEENKRPIRIWSRGSTILPAFIGKTVQIHNGRKLVPILIHDLHVGRKFGEFAPTRVPVKHSGKKATDARSAKK
jgi:small subunit ribosomal protein S19